MSTNWFNIKKRYKIFSATLENINSQLRKFSKKNGELDVGKISRASSIASIPNLESTSEFLRFTHALVDEAEELEAHGCKLDDEQRREINGLFVRTYSLISNVFKPLKHKRTSRSGLDESFGFFRIKDYNQFIEIMSLSEPGVSFYAQLDVFMEKLRIVWGDFENVSNSTIVGTTMDLLLDLCIAIEDNLIVIDTVPEKIAKSEHEDVLQDMLKYERQNPPVSDYVTSSDVSNLYKNFLTEASTSSTNKLYIDRDEFEQYSKFFENHCDVTKLWSPNVLFSKDRKYSKHALTEFIDSIRVVINEKLDSLILHGIFDTILLNATSSNSIYNSKTPSRLKITAENQFTLRLLRPLRHKNIAKILHICKNCECDQTESCTHNVLGFINDPGSFSFDVLLELGVISERILVKTSVDIVCGLAYLHKYGIMHRDLRPSNIILSGKDIKISGLDAIFNLKTQKVVRLNRNSASTYSLVMAPEVLPTRKMSRKSDIYSFGLLLYRLCVRLTSNIVEDTSKLATVAVERLTEKLREPFNSIICSSMNHERNQRPKSIDLEAQLIDHFKNIETPKIKFRLPNEQETYLHLNLLRRALVLFEPIKNSSVVAKFYMSLLLENQLGLMKFEENFTDERNTISFENGLRCFLEWEKHIEDCQNDLKHVMESVDLQNNLKKRKFIRFCI